MARRRWGTRGCVLLLLLGCTLLLPVASRAEEPDEPDDPVLEGEAKRQHQAEVKRHLAYLLDRKTQDILEEKIGVVGGERTRAARDALIQFSIGRKSKRYVRAAFLELGKLGGKTAREFLCGRHGLGSKDVLVQQYAAEGLAKTKDARATGPLLDALTNKRTKTLVAAACGQALAKCSAGDEKATEVVFAFSRHKKASIRGPVVEGLGWFGTEQAMARLREALASDRNAEVRAHAALGLGHTKRDDALEPLEKAIAEDRSHTVKKAGLAAIAEIRGEDG